MKSLHLALITLILFSCSSQEKKTSKATNQKIPQPQATAEPEKILESPIDTMTASDPNDTTYLASKPPVEKYADPYDALMIAIDNNDIETAVDIAKNSQQDSSYRNETTLMYVSEKGKLNMAKALIEAGARINQSFENEVYHLFFPVDFAVKSGNTELVEYLMSQGADVSNGAVFRNTSDTEMIKFLLEKGADANYYIEGYESSPGRPLIWNYISDNNYEAVKLMLEAGAKVDQCWYEEDGEYGTEPFDCDKYDVARGGTKQSALVLATGKEDIITLLKKFGAK
jgi:ankyrin repeat protein